MLAGGFDALAKGYGKVLRPVLGHTGITLLIGVGWVALGVFFLQNIEREFIPTADRGALPVFTRAPEGSTVDYTDRYQREVIETKGKQWHRFIYELHQFELVKGIGLSPKYNKINRFY